MKDSGICTPKIINVIVVVIRYLVFPVARESEIREASPKFTHIDILSLSVA